MTSPSSILRWTAMALVGLAIAAGVAFAASQLVSQRIGLASEPLNAGKELAPPETHRQHPRSGQRSMQGGDSATSTPGGAAAGTTRSTVPAPAPTTTFPATTTAPPTGGSTPSGEGSGSAGAEPDD